ncbi:MAG: chorismate synthase [Bacteroidia bacterium]
MAGNSIGHLFRITTYGESHGTAIGAVIDGCPAGLEIDEIFIQAEMQRRKPGQSHLTTQRKEEDTVEIISGVYEGISTGTPIHLMIKNKDQRSKDYSALKDVYRPSHADYTFDQKFGIRDHRGGGRASARETAARVAAGAIAKLLLRYYQITVTGFVEQVGTVGMAKTYTELDLSEAEKNLVRCPDAEVAAVMIAEIEKARKSGDSLGGIISCVIRNAPAGLGEPVFDKLHSDLAKAVMSINATRGFEIGAGFHAASMKGSQHNDRFVATEGSITTETNRSGGIQGGISNGEDILFRVAFKPVATIAMSQQTVDKEGREVQVEGKGRHDPCVVPRAVPIVEGMAAIVLADHLLLSRNNRL